MIKVYVLVIFLYSKAIVIDNLADANQCTHAAKQLRPDDWKQFSTCIEVWKVKQ